jgi:N12 class adenine-specific DNA methylase
MQLALALPDPTIHPDPSRTPIKLTGQPDTPLPQVSSGIKDKARDILAAIKTLRHIEAGYSSPTPGERETLARFGGFGPVAKELFPDPVTGRYKPGWQELGEELKALLAPEEYDSAKRTTFCAFYTSPAVMSAMHSALKRLGCPSSGTVLEPGCGVGNFMGMAPAGMHFVGVEMDSLSGRIAKTLYPQHDIRIENFRDTRLPQLDGVIGNVPFADIHMTHNGQKFSLHDFFFAKSVDALKPGGVLALVTSHFTLDKQNASIREYLGDRADFLGAIRLPADAFKREGTAVVTDIIFMRKRAPGEHARHEEAEWQRSRPFEIDGTEVSINRYFVRHPEMVLGTYTLKDTLYGEGYSVVGNGDLAAQLRGAIGRLPAREPNRVQDRQSNRLAPRHAELPNTPSAPPPNLAEGSFFVADDRSVCQIENSQAVPVEYGGSKLSAYGGLVGRRMAGLIKLRDLAREVLRTQNEGLSESERTAARYRLNNEYDRFSLAFGPINKTTFSETRDGNVIRRMPNIVKFREDPDAMLVMSLEDYDELTGKATKAPIMQKDVVGPKAPITRVETAEEGLLVSLNERGLIDLPFISQLYGKPEETIISELGDLIYRDPATKEWQTADAYLSGNVRLKLKQAEAAGVARNIEALKAVQPEDVLPGDIDANLGAPWIPVSDIQKFAAELFGVEPDAVPISHLEKDAVWSLNAGYAAEKSVPAIADYGTARANGTWLLELALNMKAPVIYDTIRAGDGEQKVVNAEETLAAKEKQRAIKERFKAWIFSDPDRTERLVRLYNDTYNNLRPRLFDGSHLDFPGMSQAYKLNKHQKDAVWRGMSSGNTLLAHVVGAGKTFTMAATGMKMRQAGLVKKPMYVVPNHLLEQFAREFMQLYPNAKLLVATKDDLSRDRRKFLTAKIASGDWDGIIVTHSSFERIGMSRKYQQQFLEAQIKEYNDLLIEHAGAKGSGRNMIKQIEKQKAAREEKLKDLLAENKKDDGLVFDELGVDHLFIDEAQYYKNLETPTKMDRVAGIQTGGSERAFDMYMKAQYLHQKHPGHGVTFASGTPISNTMVEMYTMQRFLDPEGLKQRGLEHFDAWAATFGEVVDTMEISPDGKTLKPRSRFAKFVNLPELQQMFRAFSDVQTADMLNLPRPTLKDGKPAIVACPMSDEQHGIQAQLVERYERIRNGGVDPRDDNALAITTDGRKLAVDARMLSPAAPDFTESKINALVENVYRIWDETRDTRRTQMIFSDMGVHQTTWGFSAYDEIQHKLIELGIPKEQIAVMGDADSDAKKQALFEKVRSGAVRVLIGSTTKMGTGTNVQKRLIALHHLDAPWKPAEVEQREGRILRQGNENPEVSIYRYVTEGSFDAYMWQALETKARFISQVMTGENGLRKAEDVGGQELSYAEVKAIASGNPAVLTLAEADAELQRLNLLKKKHVDEQYTVRIRTRDLPALIRSLTDRLEHITADNATLADDDSMVIGGRAYSRDEAIEVLAPKLDRLPLQVMSRQTVPLGTYHGLRFGMVLNPGWRPDVYLEGKSFRTEPLGDHHGPRAVINAVERLARSYPSAVKSVQQDLNIAEGQLRDYQAKLGKPFQHDTYLTELTTLRDQLKLSLAGQPKEGEPTSADLAGRIKSLKEGQQIDAALPRTVRPAVAAQESVTARILREREQSTAHQLG